MKMSLIIKNYGPLRNVKLNLNRLVVLLGNIEGDENILINVIRMIKNIYSGVITNLDDNSQDVSEFKALLRKDSLIELFVNNKSIIKLEYNKTKIKNKKNLRQQSYITFPESNLRPSNYKKAVAQIGVLFNNGVDVVVSTLSVEILEALNNLIIAGQLYKDKRVDENKLKEIVPKNQAINPRKIKAYYIKNGELIETIDKETGLISGEKLVEGFQNIWQQFDRLLELYPPDENGEINNSKHRIF